MPLAANRDALLRDLGVNDGVLPTWIDGGYPAYYLVSDEWDHWGDCCADCANGADATEKDKKGRFTGSVNVIGCDINWEYDDMACSECGAAIPSAYGDLSEAKCDDCGAELDTDCNGLPRCPDCDGPCPCCDTGPGPD